jgi:hypothetical protein
MHFPDRLAACAAGFNLVGTNLVADGFRQNAAAAIVSTYK